MVNLLHCSRDFLANQISSKKIVCFGVGKRFAKFIEYWISEENIDNILCVIDSNKVTKEIKYLRKSIPVYSIDQFISSYQCDDFILIITNIYDCMEIVKTLDQYTIFNDKNCFIEYMIDEECPNQTFDFVLNDSPKIEKVIHYCWFGKAAIPKHLQKCIDSWKVYCPDYKIVRWDENNYDIAKNKFMKDAYSAKKWGFVPDFARLDIIYNYGGFYLDTDVELIRPLDGLRADTMYCGFQDNHLIALGLGFGAVKGHRLVKKMLDTYDRLVFDGCDLNSIVSPYLQTKVLYDEGVKMNNTYQRMKDFTVYPSDVLSPMSQYKIQVNMTKNTVSIHHYDGSWADDKREKREKMERNTRDYFERAKKQENG